MTKSNNRNASTAVALAMVKARVKMRVINACFFIRFNQGSGMRDYRIFNSNKRGLWLLIIH
jgi:hypothetical protein